MTIFFVTFMAKKKTAWYVGGLHFECRGCGGCCSGPGEGYIWVTRPEIELIADGLEISVGELRRNFLRRVSLRTSIIEHAVTKDCIFLQEIEGSKQCVIYTVRPSQCRNWPFWPGNLANSKAWNEATRKCPGVNQGKFYNCRDIDRIRKNKKWWNDKK